MLKCKKFLAVWLVITLLLGIVPFSTYATEEKIKMGYIFETNVNIRKNATTTSDKLDNVSKINVAVLDSKKDTKSVKNPKTKKTFIWYKITYSTESKTITGYVREDLIKINEYTLDEDFKKQLNDFPESYHDDLILLHALYPNWQFVADNVDEKFSSAVADQDTDFRKVIETKYNSFRSMRKGCYDYKKEKFITTSGGRYGASREIIAYYMDPRNFLDSNDIYIFLEQTYNSKTQTVKGIEELVNDTFLDAKIKDKNDKYYGKRYAEAILYAAKKSKVNAYVLASTILQEQGNSGSPLTKGTTYKSKKVYNFFGYMASGSTSAEVTKSAAKYAYSQKWYTPTESIVAGAKKYGSGYIDVGQDTYYYKNFNVHNPDKLNHQYAQNVTDSVNSAIKLRAIYSDLTDLKLTFRIPVFEKMPEKVSKLPSKSSKYNNYYFEDLEAKGLTSFSKFKTKYSISTKGDLIVCYTLPEKATYQGENKYKLKKGENSIKLTVKSQTGYTKSYTLTITAKKAATLTVAPKGKALLADEKGDLYYYKDGVKKTSTTLVKHDGKYHYVKKGKWTKSTLVFKYSDKKYYVKNGVVQSDYSGTKKIDGKTYKIKKGIVV